MGESKQIHLDPVTITNILTLRYDPTMRTLLPRLTWKDFTEDSISNPFDFVIKLLKEAIEKEISKLGSGKLTIALSGGVDSTLLLAMIRSMFPQVDIHAITVKIAGSVDESSSASKIAQNFEAEQHTVYIENYLQELPKAISIVKLPFWDLHWYHVVKKASSLSKVLVSGDGGDELFGGYIFRYNKFLRLMKNNSSVLEKVKAYLQCHERDWVPDQETLFGKKVRFSWNKIYGMLRPYFNNKLSPIAQVFLADFNGKLLYNWLPLYIKFYRNFKVKPVSPFLSRKLISYATHIPYDYKYDRGSNVGKLLLRRILAKYVDERFVSNTKQGFPVDTVNQWKLYGRKICDYYLSDARICKEGWINPDWIKKHIRRLNDNQLNVEGVIYVNKFLGLLALEIWYRLFVTKEMKPDVHL